MAKKKSKPAPGIEEELNYKNLLLSTQLESSIDGILVVSEYGKILSSNRRFMEMWNIPAEIMDSGLDERAIEFVLEKLSNPERFLEKVKYIHEHPMETSRDELAFKDGRVFDRYPVSERGCRRS